MVESGPNAPCDCDNRFHMVCRPSWRAWGGTKMRMRCQRCKKEWPHQIAKGTGRVF